MKLETFIQRPVLSAVISILIVSVGIISLATLPVERFPDIAPPTISVSTSYPGASAETIQKSVIVPLEEAINGVENMNYITSSATNTGSATITVYFKQGVDPDMAAVNVQNRVARATGNLPSTVNQIGVTVNKRQTSMLKIFSLYSPDSSYDEGFLANYLMINVIPEILRISGVGDAMVLGANYSMRIWMKPDVMAQYGLIPSDISAVLAEQNIEAATGSFGESSNEMYQYTMKYKGRLLTPEEFGEIVIRSTADGEVLKLKDVATVELGRESYNFIGQTDGCPGITAMVYQTAGSNATKVVQDIDKFLEEIRPTLPKGTAIVSIMSVTDFLYASIREVFKTLFEAIILVIIVVYIFLQDLKSTLIPLVGIIVSLIGTFACMMLFGFSINLITLFALVLVIGTVVDDSIVVVEAVQSKFDEGYRSPYKASVDAMKGISAAVVTSSLVFMAVFIPVSFMGGTSGTFYTQFGLTMAVAVGISAVNALTLSPALCALLLRPYTDESGEEKDNFAARFRHAFNSVFNSMSNKYKGFVVLFIRRRWIPWTMLGGTVILLVVLMSTIPTSLVPEEDQGTVFVNVTTPAGYSLTSTAKVMNEIEEAIRTIPQIEDYTKVCGYGMIAGQGSSYGMFITNLKPWDDRPRKSDAVSSVIKEIYRRTAGINEATIFAMAPGMIPGYGMGNSLEINVQDRVGGDVNELYNVTQDFLAGLRASPVFQSAFSSFSVNYPQWLVDVDAAKCKRAGVSPNEVLSVLSGYYGGTYASNINRFSKVYRVMVQAAIPYRATESSLDDMFVRINGEMAPLSQFVTLKRVYGSETLSRFNLYNSINVNASPAPGYSTGDAIAEVARVSQETLPNNFSYSFGGITREEASQSNNTAIIFGICIFFIYLILCAMYESFLLPFAVILSVPFGLLGSFLFAKMLGLENNIYLQVGLIMLIGLISKTAILLTEYAVDRRMKGMTLAQAALSAAKARLRPILMTASTMIIGLLPLMTAMGVGANGNRSLGSGVVGGMLFGTVALLIVVPVFFIIFQSLQEKVKPLHFNSDNQHEDNE